MTQLGEQAQLDPATRQALDKLPAVIRPLSVGGPTGADLAPVALPMSPTPERTFGILRDLLGTLETRLASVKSQIEDAAGAGARHAVDLAAHRPVQYRRRSAIARIRSRA